MIVTSTDGYILNIFGHFLADSTNNDASIINHCLFQNNYGILNWPLDDDVMIFGSGFRDAISSMKMIRLQPAVLDFLIGGRQQFDAIHAKRTRYITKVRWVVESSETLSILHTITIPRFFSILVNAIIKKWRFLAQSKHLT